MDAIRVSKIEGVTCTRLGATRRGTIHLTAHHLIFRYDEDAEKEMWVPYPIISFVSCLPQTLHGQSPVNFHTRTFETFSLSFDKESETNDVFESVKELTVATSITQLYAFFYRPNPPFPTSNGWAMYTVRDEFGRMGVGTRSKAWRFTDINKDYSFSPTYPARLVVPTRISDTTLQYASKYRSKCRIPILSYLHWANYGSITRSSQPMVGITQNRSIQDEKLIEAIFQTHVSPEARASNVPVYGATATNLIIDARPTANAMANTAKGAGTENMDHYKEGKKVYLGIDHIHAMRESLGKVVEALREADAVFASINIDLPETPPIAVLDRQALRRSGWLRHIAAILEGTVVITRNVHVNSSHVLIHCSDGWDRTSQLSALSQICLDPFYRTIHGFQILIEKDWLSFGHKFLDRCGHLSSEKFFVSSIDAANSGGAEAFLASVQNRFASQNHVKETSPVFHQFLESVRQVQRQFPNRFEFNERFLHQLYYHLYSCQFGTFLFNCERDRRVGDGSSPPCERTVSVWDFLNTPSEMSLNRNPTYDPTMDDPSNHTSEGDMGVLFPNPKDVRFWHELYGRTDEEMNGRPYAPQPRAIEIFGPVENAMDDPAYVPRTATPSIMPTSSSPLSKPTLSQSMRSLNVTAGLSHSPKSALQELSSSTSDFSASQTVAKSNSNLLVPSSDISIQPARMPSPSPQLPSNRTRPEFLPSSGVKSIWGKLSSNASAALSAMQETYSNVAKDIIGTGEGETSTKTAELRDRGSLNAWGEDPASILGSPNPSSQASLFPSSNAWAPLPPASKSSLPTFEENPWGSVRTSARQFESESSLPPDPTVGYPTSPAPLSRQAATSVTRMSKSSNATSSSLEPAPNPVLPDALPYDPTIAHPPSRSTRFSPASTSGSRSTPSITQTTSASTLPQSSPIATDPLGVGLF